MNGKSCVEMPIYSHQQGSRLAGGKASTRRPSDTRLWPFRRDRPRVAASEGPILILLDTTEFCLQVRESTRLFRRITAA